MEYLDLSYNGLDGEIPAELGNLVNLEQIYLSGNQLTGCVPTSLYDQLKFTQLGGLPFSEVQAATVDAL